MKLKALPEDFQVEEIAAPPPADPRGDYLLFRLEKRGVAAFEALGRIARHLGVVTEAVAFAGLKDQRSRATQLASVRFPHIGGAAEALLGAGGPRISVAAGLALEPLGRAARPVSADDIVSNRFAIVVRELTDAQARALPERVEAVRRDGVPNYFDDQRFGGASPERGFVAEAWSRGEHRRALELLIARPSPKDPKRERLEKKKIAAAIAAAGGGLPDARAWAALGRELRGEAAPVVRALGRAPADLAGAFRALDARFRALLVAQYQSYLWNEAVRAEVRAALPRAATFDVMYRCGTLTFWRAGGAVEGLAPLASREIPFVQVPLPEALGLRPKGGARRLRLIPNAIAVSPPEADEVHAGHRKVLLRMELSRASYATIVVKRLVYEPNAAPGSNV